MPLIDCLMKLSKPHFTVCHLIFTRAGLLKHVCQRKTRDLFQGEMAHFYSVQQCIQTHPLPRKSQCTNTDFERSYSAQRSCSNKQLCQTMISLSEADAPLCPSSSRRAETCTQTYTIRGDMKADCTFFFFFYKLQTDSSNHCWTDKSFSCPQTGR